jgi:hypothetical protein
MKLVEITLAGFKRQVSESLLDAYKSLGCTIPGAMSGTPGRSQVSQDSSKTKTVRKKKEKA